MAEVREEMSFPDDIGAVIYIQTCVHYPDQGA